MSVRDILSLQRFANDVMSDIHAIVSSVYLM